MSQHGHPCHRPRHRGAGVPLAVSRRDRSRRGDRLSHRLGLRCRGVRPPARWTTPRHRTPSSLPRPRRTASVPRWRRGVSHDRSLVASVRAWGARAPDPGSRSEGWSSIRFARLSAAAPTRSGRRSPRSRRAPRRPSARPARSSGWQPAIVHGATVGGARLSPGKGTIGALVRGQPDHRRRPAAPPAMQRHLAAPRPHELPGDRQSEPVTGGSGATGGATA